MGRRRRNRGLDAVDIVRIVGVVLLICLISPVWRQIFASIMFIGICLLCVALVGLGIFWAYKSWKRSRREVDDIVRNVKCRVLDFDAVEVQLKNAEVKHPEVKREQFEDVEVMDVGRSPQTTAELLEQLRTMDWFQFEKIAALVYRKHGYAVTRRGGANADGGIDLVLEKGGKQWAVQCKQWKTWNVGVRAVREFVGGLADAGIPNGIFITLRGYTGGAKHLAERHGIEMLNEAGLAELIEKTGARWDPEALEILEDTRKFCPKCERELVLRTAERGPGAGEQFWGCSAYPKCHFTMRV